MRADVFHNDTPIGTIEWETDSRGVQVVLDCALCGEGALLRCYAVCGGQTLRVGLPEPEGGRLRLRRRLSREMLREAGCETPPERFYLALTPETAQPVGASAAPIGTGDAVLDALLSNENVQIQPTETGLRLQCPFDPQKPFALAPAFVLCRVEGKNAVLEWKKDAANAAASSEKA